MTNLEAIEQKTILDPKPKQLGPITIKDYLKKDYLQIEDYLHISKEFFRKYDQGKNYKIYPEIDLSFLKMSSTIKQQKTNTFNKIFEKIGLENLTYREISVPKFSVYKYFGNTNNFKIQMYDGVVQFNEELNPIITDPLLQTLQTPKKIEIESRFNGLIPQNVKKNISLATRLFNEKEIYLIAETKPEDWAIKKITENPKIIITEDPIIIGIEQQNNYNRAYLIDHFDCTPIEAIVKDNFVKFKGN